MKRQPHEQNKNFKIQDGGRPPYWKSVFWP